MTVAMLIKVGESGTEIRLETAEISRFLLFEMVSSLNDKLQGKGLPLAVIKDVWEYEEY